MKLVEIIIVQMAVIDHILIRKSALAKCLKIEIRLDSTLAEE